jgi:hypothetical protein
MISNVQPSNQASLAVSVGRIRFTGIACLIGGLLWVLLVSVEQLQAVPSIFSELLIPIPMLLGLLVLHASGSGRMKQVGLIGTSISLLGVCLIWQLPCHDTS